MSAERVPVVQEMILAETEEERSKALAQLLPMQQEDFAGIFKAMSGLPVTIRLLDPPLHEFLPNLEQLIVQQERLRYQPDADPAELEQLDKLLRKVRALHEMNRCWEPGLPPSWCCLRFTRCRWRLFSALRSAA